MRSSIQENPEKLYSSDLNKPLSNEKVVLNYGNSKYKSIKDVFSDENKKPGNSAQKKKEDLKYQEITGNLQHMQLDEKPKSQLVNAIGKYDRNGIETIVEPVKRTNNEDNFARNLYKQSEAVEQDSNKYKFLENRSQLRLLLRFNCGKCQKRYSQIIVPKEFARECEKCKYPSDLVVLRCDESNLIGGFLCCKCENRFLDKLCMTEFNKITPFCFECNRYSKLYQALINRSKISVRNEKVYSCVNCKQKKSISFYQPRKPKNNLICCENLMEFTSLIRTFKYHQLDEEGRSEMYSREDYHKTYRISDYLKNERKRNPYENYKYYSDRDREKANPPQNICKSEDLMDKLLNSKI